MTLHSIPRLLLALSGFVAFTLSPPAIASDASDMDPHLPDDVVLAAMRFRAFSRKADDKNEWEQQQREFLASLTTRLEQASLNNNRAASALRTLISDLKEAKFVPRKKPQKIRSTEYPLLSDGNRVMIKEDFHIDKPESRSQSFLFELKRVPAMIRVGIGGGHDDSGDGGLHYLLIDPVGRVIKRGFSDSDEFIWEEHLSTRGGKWKLIIEDLDTDLTDKKSPGNRGAVEVLVKAE